MLAVMATTAGLTATSAMRSLAAGENGELNGDYATVASLKMVYKSTGTEPFDADDAAGNDSSAMNSVIRSFDSASYTVQYVTTPRDSSPSKYFSTARVKLVATLPLPSDKAMFDADALAWASTEDGYQMKVETSEVGGKTVQTLTAWRKLEGTDSTPNVVPGTGTLTVPIKVRAMVQGETIQPTIAVSLEHNPDADAKTLALDELTVSSVPKYNVRVKRQIADRVGTAGEWDFSQGTSEAPNKDAGKVRGRLYAYGVTLEMRNDSVAKGLKGLEAPSGKITFDVGLSVRALYGGKASDATQTHTPLLFIGGVNDTRSQPYGRDVRQFGGNLMYPDQAAPDGKYHEEVYDYNKRAAVRDGGTWDVTQSGATLGISVDGYVIDPDTIPVHDYRTNNPANGAYANEYGPNVLAFSAGKLMLIQPFENSETGQSPNDEYQSDEVTFEVSVSDTNLRATGRSGASVPVVTDTSNQVVTSDDVAMLTQFVKVPGTYDMRIAYTGDGNNSVSEFGTDSLDYTGNYSRGDDASMVTGTIGALWGIMYKPGELDNMPVYNESLLKFDSSALRFVKPKDNDAKTWFSILAKVGSDTGVDALPKDKVALLYAVKADGTGWASDEEQKQTTIDELEYYDDYDAWQASGKTMVGLLVQTRYAANGTVQRNDLRTKVTFETGTKPEDIGKVAMITVADRFWNRADLAAAAATKAGKSVDDLTVADYQAYADSIPSMAAGTYGGYLPKPSIDTNRGPRYTKAYYDADGNYAGGHTGGYTFGDSLLITGETAQVSVTTAQQADSSPKQTYDLDYLQRHADFVVTPKLTVPRAVNNGAPTTLHVTATIPKGLAYVPASSYIGGTYTERTPSQGTVSGGRQVEPTATQNADGSVTLAWDVALANNTDEVPRVYFSTLIGTAGEEATDVRNNDLLTAKATISSTYDKRVQTAPNGNIADFSIRMAKLMQASLSISASPIISEFGGTVTFDSRTGNFGNNAKMDALSVNLLPYDGGGASSYSGTYSVTGITMGDGVSSKADVKVYATTDEGIRGTGISKLTVADVSGWTELAFDAATGKVTVPSGMSHMVAWAVVKGTLPADEQMRFTTTIAPQGNGAGDVYEDSWTDGDNTVTASSYVAQRKVSGIVWNDANRDGIRQDGEEPVEGATVSVLDVTGKVVTTLDGKVATMTTGKDGTYEFDALPAGAVTVKASPSVAGAWDGYQASPKDEGDDDTVDSDGDATLSDGKLSAMTISGITLPELSSMHTNVFSSEHNDFGINEIPRPSLTVEKSYTVKGHEDDDAYKVVAGDVISYTARVTNTGNVPLAPVTVTDALTGLDAKKVADSLAPGKSVDAIDLGTHTVTQADVDAGKVVNSVSAHGEPPTGIDPPEDPTDEVETPTDASANIRIEKEWRLKTDADGDSKGDWGDVIEYRLTVTNTGKVTLTDVIVNDAKLKVTGKKVSDSLAPGKSVTVDYGSLPDHEVTRDEASTGTPITNEADTTGTPPAPLEKPTDDDSVETPVDEPLTVGLAVEKSAELTNADGSRADKAGAGVTITYKATVTNTGTAPLTDVTVDDAKLGITGMKVAGTLEAGKSATVTLGTHTITQAEVDAGTSIANTVTANGTPSRPYDPPTPPTDTVEVPVGGAPAIKVEKSADITTDANGNGKGDVGDVVTYAVKVTNTGSVTLTDVTITDTMLGIDAMKVADSLTPGQSVDVPAADLPTHEITAAEAAAGKLTNTVTTTGQPPKGTPPTDDDRVEVPTVVPSASLAVRKSVSVKGHAGEDGYMPQVGDTLVYKATVTNTGNVTLSPVTVTDAMLGIDARKVADSLDAGKSVDVDLGEHVVTQDEFDAGTIANTVSAHGTPPTGVEQPKDPSDTVETHMNGSSGIRVEKSATISTDANGNGKADVGDVVTYAVRVTNTGTTTLTDVVVTDAMLGIDAMKVADSLAPGKSVEVPAKDLPPHTVTADEAKAGTLSNTVAATGQPPKGTPPTDKDRVKVPTVIPSSGLAVRKSVSIKGHEDNGGYSPKVGDVLSYKATVTNTGNVTLSPVTVTDAMLGLSAKKVADSLEPGKSVDVSLGEHTVTQDDYDAGVISNTVSVHGVPPTGIDAPKDPTDTVNVSMNGMPGIRVEKSAKVSTDADGDGIADMGDVIAYTIRVTNTGTVTLRDVTVDDAMLGIRGLKVSSRMEPGDVVDVPAKDVPTHTVTPDEAYAGKVTNEVTATGKTTGGKPVTDKDTAEVPSHAPTASLTVKKSYVVRGHEKEASYSAVEGDVIEYTARVDNTGDVTLSPVMITDALLGIRDRKVADSLEPGKGIDVTLGTHTVTAEDAKAGKVTNGVSAHGVPPTGVRQPEDPTDSVETPTHEVPRNDMGNDENDAPNDGGIDTPPNGAPNTGEGLASDETSQDGKVASTLVQTGDNTQEALTAAGTACVMLGGLAVAARRRRG